MPMFDLVGVLDGMRHVGHAIGLSDPDDLVNSVVDESFCYWTVIPSVIKGYCVHDLFTYLM